MISVSFLVFFFFKQKTAYEMRISDWSSDVCSSDLTALADAIEVHLPHYVLLAGFMRVLTPAFVERFNGRLINIHPSLLPAFPGLHTHQQALATGVQWHGCTIHFVTPVLDHGPSVAQGVVPVLADDSPDDLAGRVLKVEHRMYADVVRWLAEGRVSLDAMQRVHVRRVASRSFVLTPPGVDQHATSSTPTPTRRGSHPVAATRAQTDITDAQPALTSPHLRPTTSKRQPSVAT